ncbi:MAG: hypothetical protein ABW184_10835 [Sphingobium sp.]
MTSDRMKQAMGRIERAISRLETTVERISDHSAAQEGEITRLNAEIRDAERRHADLSQIAAAQGDPDALPPLSHDKALAALRSLDALIEDLQRARRDG